MTRHWALVVLLLLAGCTPVPSRPPDVTGATRANLQGHVGEPVTFRGKFSLRGKVGPFVVGAGQPIYLVPRGTFTWGEPYAGMEQREVWVTGTLRRASAATPDADAVAASGDYFFVEAETAIVRLVEDE